MTVDPKKALLDLFGEAVENQPIPNEPHVADDDELLIRWSRDQLSNDERDHLIDHLSRCPLCRRVLAELIRDAVLFSDQEKGRPEDKETRRQGD